MKTFRKTFVKSFIKKKLLGKASAKKPLRKASAKAQSAMEYLMTYGWAILIISVVLAALFQLGVFNPMTFTPKAPPGSCQVFRPNGPGTTSFINLEGICSGELPQYVASFNGRPYTQQLIWIPGLGARPSMTVTEWVELSKLSSTNLEVVGPVVSGTDCTGQHIFLYIGDNNQYIGIWGGCDDWPSAGAAFAYSPNVWYFLAYTYNTSSKVITLYKNGGTTSASTTMSFNTPAMNEFDIGNADNGNVGQTEADGYIANVQYYNTTLSANEIQALYLEGIGGAPIDLQHLVAWWPLNGNANDYSGNNYNAQTRNVSFVSNWYNGYTPP